MIYFGHSVMLILYHLLVDYRTNHPMTQSTKRQLQRRHIQTLVAVGDSRSVHRAARELGMPQPAVSRLLAEAEQMLGARLFERSSHGSKPTAQGEAILAQARFALRGIERLNDVITKEGPTIKLGCIPRAMYTLVPRLLDRVYSASAEDAETHAANLGFRFSVTEGSSATLLEALSRGSLDFAILRSTSGATDLGDDLIMEPLYNDRIVIVCAAENPALPKTPITLKRLVDQGWVLPQVQTTSRAAFDRFWAEHSLPPIRPVIEVRSFETNLALVAGTRFISIAPESIARRHTGFGQLRVLQVRPALPGSPVMLAFNRMIEGSGVLNGFRRLIHDTALAARRQMAS
jgi:DNA-binding transcriptional LysR family regulator